MRVDLQTRLVGVIAALIVLTPQASRACAVCFSSRTEAGREAFTNTTIFLTLLPLMLVGGTVWWLRRRARQLDRGGAEAALDQA